MTTGGASPPPCARRKAVLGWVREGVAPPATGVRCITIGKFWKFYVRNGAFGGKIELCLDSKQNANMRRSIENRRFFAGTGSVSSKISSAKGRSAQTALLLGKVG